jgi:NTE family protein
LQLRRIAVKTESKKISLALQGGGAYGAFTWGVLEHLLGDERLEIAAISGSSAGAINAVALADGLGRGGRPAAQASLQRFWTATSQAAQLSPFFPTPFDGLLGRGSLQGSPGYQLLPLWGALSAPGQLVNTNPLTFLLGTLIDFARVRAFTPLQLFVLATNVRTGRARIFRRDELELPMVLASACLPHLHGAVDIGGETYWDGSYVANPALAPLLGDGLPDDVVIVQNNPVARAELPHTIADVINRANEIAFNVSLVREISDMRHLHGVVDEQCADRACPAVQTRLHLISGNDRLARLNISSKFNAAGAFVSYLHDLGCATAERWLGEHFADLGERATLDPARIFYPERETGSG